MSNLLQVPTAYAYSGVFKDKMNDPQKRREGRIRLGDLNLTS